MRVVIARCLVRCGWSVPPVRLVLVLSIAVLVLDRLFRRGLRSLDQPSQQAACRGEPRSGQRPIRRPASEYSAAADSASRVICRTPRFALLPWAAFRTEPGRIAAVPSSQPSRCASAPQSPSPDWQLVSGSVIHRAIGADRAPGVGLPGSSHWVPSLSAL